MKEEEADSLKETEIDAERSLVPDSVSENECVSDSVGMCVLVSVSTREWEYVTESSAVFVIDIESLDVRDDDADCDSDWEIDADRWLDCENVAECSLVIEFDNVF